MEKTKEVSYQEMGLAELEELRLDYVNEKERLESRVEWLSRECETLQQLIDERAEEEAFEEEGCL